MRLLKLYALSVFSLLCLESFCVYSEPTQMTITDALNHEEISKIGKASWTKAHLNAAPSNYQLFSSSNLPEKQRFFDQFYSANVNLVKSAAIKKMSVNGTALYLNTVFNWDYTNSPLYHDALWHKRFNEYWHPEMPNGVSIAQPDSTHPDCACLANSDGYGASGVLIAPQLVLTAAHCYYKGFTNHVLFGANIYAPNEIVQVAKAIVYQGFSTNLPENDICLLILAAPVVDISYCKIATSEIITNATYGSIVGFGTTDVFGYTGFGTRRSAYPIILGNPYFSLYEASGTKEMVGGMLLYDLSKIGFTTCEGDSGGPIYLQSNGANFIAGITSRGVEVSDEAIKCGMGSIFERLDIHLDWIRSIAKANKIEFDE